MSRRILFSSVLVAAMVAATTPTRVSAYSIYSQDKLTFLTFSGSVQIPGATLDAGTYRFRLANPTTGRNVLQVLSHDGAIVYSMFHTIPDSRTTLTEETVVTFKETPAGVPPAVKSLFYGGEYSGYEFVYPKGEPNMTPPVWPQPPITYTPVIAVMPEVAEVMPMESEPQAPTGAALPRTASPLPFVGFGGLTSLLLGLAVALFRRHSS